MQRLHQQVLPAVEQGQGHRYAQVRCVNPSTVTTWRNSSLVMEVLDEKEIEISQFEQFQPSHADFIGRHFRKQQKPPWSDETKEQIIEWVDRCEAELCGVC